MWPPGYPHWGVYFHEIGHNFTFRSFKLGHFMLSHSDFDYSEGLASLAGMYAIRKMIEDASKYGLSDQIVSTLQDQSGWRFLENLDDYIAAGADYTKIDPNIVDGIMVRLQEEYGLSLWYRFFSVFIPPQEAIDVALKNDAKVATYFVAACSAAARTDLRKLFRKKWGFPIKNAFFNKIYQNIKIAAAQRDPRARISSEVKVKVGSVVNLDGNRSWDPQGLPLTYLWSIARKPAGSMATLSDPSSESPNFTPDKEGKYTVELSVKNGLVGSSVEKKVIRAEY
jgi:hypothetical protein